MRCKFLFFLFLIVLLIGFTSSCSLKSARWSVTDADVGDTVSLRVVAGGSTYTGDLDCTGKNIIFKIYEDDIVKDVYVATPTKIENYCSPPLVSPLACLPNEITTWKVMWVEDTESGEFNPPEYYFTATVEGTTESIRSGNLRVNSDSKNNEDIDTCPSGISAGDSCSSWIGGCYCGNHNFYCGNYNNGEWKWFDSAPTCGSTSSCKNISYDHGNCNWENAVCWYDNEDDGGIGWRWTYKNEIEVESGEYACSDGIDNDCDKYIDERDSDCSENSKENLKETREDTKFKYAYWSCYNGETQVQGGESSCKSSEVWRNYAKDFCENKCYGDGSKCGLNSFGVKESCSSGSSSDASSSIQETVTCTFVNSLKEQICYSQENRFDCSGEESCAINVWSDEESEKLIWESSCDGTYYTIVDGNDESVEFICDNSEDNFSLITVDPLCSIIGSGENCANWTGDCYLPCNEEYGIKDLYCGNYEGEGWKWFNSAPDCNSDSSCDAIDYTKTKNLISTPQIYESDCNWEDAYCAYNYNEGKANPSWGWVYSSELSESGTVACNDKKDNDCDGLIDELDEDCSSPSLIVRIGKVLADGLRGIVWWDE